LLSTDEEAQFFEFHSKTSAPLFRKAYRMCLGHEADAQDALQRTYLKALVSWSIVSGLTDSQRHAWLATTLTNEILQIWRVPYRSRETSSHDASEEADAFDSDADSAHDRDRLRRACRAIARLEGRPGKVIALHCLAGYEISEVAEILGISAATVRVHLHTGRARLRAIIAEEEAADRDHA
jgi:RNA polymerase sigma-70 factor (ECF subfamily)